MNWKSAKHTEEIGGSNAEGLALNLTKQQKQCFTFILYLAGALLCGIGVWFIFGGVEYTSIPFILALSPAFYFFLKRGREIEFPGKLAANLCHIFSILLTFSLFLGKGIVASAGISSDDYRKLSLLALPGLFLLLDTLLRFLMHFLLKQELRLQEHRNVKRFFLLCWGGIFILWLPYLIAQLPAVLDFDAIKQMDMLAGLRPMTDHHPFAHTMLIRLCLTIGGGSPTAYAVIQMVLLSLIFAFSTAWVYSKGVSKGVCMIIAAYFALNPVHASFSVTMWKDVLFGGFVLLFTVVLCEVTMTKGDCLRKPSWLLLLLLSALGMAFFRNNGPMALAVLAVVLLIVFRRAWKQWVAVFACVFILLGIVKGPVFDAVGVEPTTFTESLGIPLQQIARVVAVGGDISQEQLDTLDSFVSVETVKRNYNPYCVDYIKSEVYGADFHHEVLEEKKGEFFRLWFELLLKNPKIYIESYLDSTYGFWYPLSDSFVAYWHNVHTNQLGLEQITISPAFSRGLGLMAEKGWKMNIPSLCVFSVLFFAAAAWVKKGKAFLIPFLPVILLWMTILIAAPIATSLRYVYYAFTAVPVLAAFALLPEQKGKVEK